MKGLASDTPVGDLRLEFGSGDVLVVENFTRASFTANEVIL